MLPTPRAAAALVALLLAASVGAALPQGPAAVLPLWSQPLGPGEGGGIAALPDGDTLVAGSIGGTLALWRLDPLGGVRWSSLVPGAFGHAVAALPTGGAVVVGAAPGEGGSDAFAAGFDEAGALRWTRRVATPLGDHFRGVAASPDGQAIYAVGATGHDVLAARFDPNGRHRWSERLGGSAEEVAEAAVALRGGGLILAGWNYDGLRNRVFLAELDAFGNAAWQRSLTAERGASLRALAIAASPLGEVTIAGVEASRGKQAPFVARLDRSGEVAWMRVLEAEPGGEARAVAPDLLGGAVVAGAVPGTGGSDAFVLRVDPGGAVAWRATLDQGGRDAAFGLAGAGPGLWTLGATGAEGPWAARFLDLSLRPG